MHRIAQVVIVLAAFGVACGSRSRDADEKAKGSATASSVASATATGSPLPSSRLATPPSASAAVDAQPLPFDASDRPKLEGMIVFAGKVKGAGSALYAASLDTLPLQPKRLVEGGSDWSIGEPSIDPSGKTVLFTHDHHENSSAPPDEVWAVPTAGGDAHRVAKCTATCRSPYFLEDGRIVSVDHGLGLNSAVIRMVTAAGKTTAVYGGDASISACFVGLHVDPSGKYLAVRVSNDLGWPECKTDRSFATSATDLKLLALPATVPGRGLPRAGTDGRVYFVGGTDESPIPSSIRIDGGGLRSPDPAFDGNDLPHSGWSIAVVDSKLIARPPAGATNRPVVIFEADEIDALYQTSAR